MYRFIWKTRDQEKLTFSYQRDDVKTALKQMGMSGTDIVALEQDVMPYTDAETANFLNEAVSGTSRAVKADPPSIDPRTLSLGAASQELGGNLPAPTGADYQGWNPALMNFKPNEFKEPLLVLMPPTVLSMCILVS